MLTNLRQLLLTAGSFCLLFLALGMCEPVIKYSMHSGEFQSYSNFVIDKANSKIIVATTNSLLKVSYDLRKDIQVSATPDEIALRSCSNIASEEDCRNYHRVLLLPAGNWKVSYRSASWNVSTTILTCSSNAFSPRCYYRDRSSLEELTSFSSNFPSFTPYGPFRWIPSLWTSNGRLVVATPTDSNLVNFGITMSSGPFFGQVQATTLNKRLWFNGDTPRAVSLHEIGEYIYLFFREEAVEAKEEVVYSRVARMCENDTGILHNRSGRHLFTTFLKARIACSSSANSTSKTYNEIYDTFYLPSHKRLYAAFQTTQNDSLGSVVCAFTFGVQPRDLDNVFKGRYLWDRGRAELSKSSNPHPFTCSSGRSLQHILRYQLVESTVNQSSLEPVVRMEGYAFQRFLVDIVDGSSEMLFITATKQGSSSLLLLKILALVDPKTRSPTHHIILTTMLAKGSADSTHFVTKMEQLGSGPDAHIYIGTETDLYRVPVQNCSSHSTCCQCVAARDPYCAYDTSTKMCHGRDLDSSSDSDVQDLVGGKCRRCRHGAQNTVWIAVAVVAGVMCLLLVMVIMYALYKIRDSLELFSELFHSGSRSLSKLEHSSRTSSDNKSEDEHSEDEENRKKEPAGILSYIFGSHWK